jgi:hypothetical protein
MYSNTYCKAIGRAGPLPAAARLSLPRGHGGGLGWGLAPRLTVPVTVLYCALQRFANNTEHAFLILQDVVVPEAENSPASTGQKRIASVMVARSRMLTAVGLDNQPGVDASEVDEIRPDRKLSTESETEPVSPEEIPQTLLGVGRPPTQDASASGDGATASHSALSYNPITAR